MQAALRALPLAVMVLGCTSDRAHTPVGEQVAGRNAPGGWTVPHHLCEVGESHNVPQKDGTTVQTCSVNGVLEGRFVTWHSSGTKAQEGTYKAGVRVGEWVWWHDNSKLATRGTFLQDHEVGQWVWWHRNGQQEARGDHLDGRRAGMWTTWFANGQKRNEGQYQNGAKEGRWTHYTGEGELAHEEIWQAGEMLSTTEVEPK